MPEMVFILGFAGVMFAISGLAYKIISLFKQRAFPADDLAGQALWWLTMVGVGVSAGLMIHALLMLFRFEWGRVGMLIYSVIAIVLTPPMAWVRIARGSAWVEYQRASGVEIPDWAGSDTSVVTVGAVMHVLFALVALIYPLTLLYQLTRPRIRRAFRDAARNRRQ